MKRKSLPIGRNFSCRWGGFDLCGDHLLAFETEAVSSLPL